MRKPNEHSIKLRQQGEKRRAKFLRAYNRGETTRELAEKEGVSETRMRWMLARAREEQNKDAFSP